jgi:hypothetical protein
MLKKMYQPGSITRKRGCAVGIGPARRPADRPVRVLIQQQQVRQADGYRR